MFNPVAPYRYLHPTVYLFMAVNPDLFVCSYWTWICLEITHFYEEQRQPFSESAWPACQKIAKWGPYCWGREVSTQFAQQFVTGVTASPLVGCVVWSTLQPLSHGMSDSGDMEVFTNYPNTETWQGHLHRIFVSVYLAFSAQPRKYWSLSKLSPWLSLYSFYIADMPRPTEPVKRVCYADDLTGWVTGVKIPDLEDSINS